MAAQPIERTSQGPAAALEAPLYGATAGAAWSRFWKKYATFTGRASRSEFWLAFVVLLVINLAFSLAAYLVAGIEAQPAGIMGAVAIYIVWGLWGLVTLVPHLSVAARRLHDADRSAGWIFIALVPLVGPIVLIVQLARASNDAGARYDAVRTS